MKTNFTGYSERNKCLNTQNTDFRKFFSYYLFFMIFKFQPQCTKCEHVAALIIQCPGSKWLSHTLYRTTKMAATTIEFLRRLSLAIDGKNVEDTAL